MVTNAPRLGGMTPAAFPVPHFAGTRLRDDARPEPAWREELRRSPNARNAVTIASMYVQAAVVI
ncbi:MAG: hypothetical protein ACKOE7_14625, partial [Actinomycetota bacterium]